MIADNGEITAESSPGYEGLSSPLLDRDNLVASDRDRAGNLIPAEGDAGSVRLEAREVRLTNGGTVATNSEAADGGNVTIEATELVHLDSGTITASVNGGSETTGGNIALDPEVVLLENDSQIVARAFGGQGGMIVINAGNYFAFPDSVVSASAGNPALSGAVEVSTPDVNLAGTLAALPTSYLDAASLMKEPCAARRSGERAGSFAVRAQDGIPPEPDGWLPATANVDALGAGLTRPSTPSGGRGTLLAGRSCP